MTASQIARERLRKECDERGISWVRAALPNRNPDIQEVYREWIDEYERKDAADIADEQRRLAQESINAARLAAETSRDSAQSSKRSAFWTMWAAIAAAVSALVPLLQAFGWLPGK